MNYKCLILLVILLSFCFVTPTYAYTIREYEEFKKRVPNSDYIKTYMNGVGTGFFWSNTMLSFKGKQPLYCQSGNLVLNANSYIRILEDEILKGNYTKDILIENILLNGLIRTFPCLPDDE